MTTGEKFLLSVIIIGSLNEFVMIAIRRKLDTQDLNWLSDRVLKIIILGAILVL